MMLMPKHARFLLLLTWILGELGFAHADSPLDARDEVIRNSLISLIADVQARIENPIAAPAEGPVSQRPDDPKLAQLGQPEKIELSSSTAAQGLLNFNAHVVHKNGISDWTLGTLDKKIIIYSFSVSAVGPEVKAADRDVVAAPAAPVADPRVVEFLFATTREKIAGSLTDNVSFSGERNLGPLTYGAASVRIPDDHKAGNIELPSSWKLFGLTWSTTPDEHKHFIIKRAIALSEEDFDRIAKEKEANTALVFVHGFDNTFEDSLYRNAQIVWDLQYKGLSILFSWASRGDMKDYLYDKESAFLARDEFISLLGKLKRDYGIDKVNVLAHSMGNLIALDALSSNARTSNPVNIARLVMAAPDVDRDLFEQLVPQAKNIIGSMTLYASSADRAMQASRTLAGQKPRAGDVLADGPAVLPQIETIDVSAVGSDILGLNHDVFASSRDVIADLSVMLRFNLPPPRISLIRPEPEPPSATKYWRYVP